jgi:hypothetical protein
MAHLLTSSDTVLFARDIQHMHGEEKDERDEGTGAQQVTAITVVMEASASTEALEALWQPVSPDTEAAPTPVSFSGNCTRQTIMHRKCLPFFISGFKVDLSKCTGEVWSGKIGEFLLMVKALPAAERLRHYRVCLGMRWLRGPKGQRKLTKQKARAKLLEATEPELVQYASNEAKRRGERL